MVHLSSHVGHAVIEFPTLQAESTPYDRTYDVIFLEITCLQNSTLCFIWEDCRLRICNVVLFPVIKMLHIYQVWKSAHVHDSAGRNMSLTRISLLGNSLRSWLILSLLFI